jgi:hypothetical protein
MMPRIGALLQIAHFVSILSTDPMPTYAVAPKLA